MRQLLRILLVILMLAAAIYWLWTGNKDYLPYVMMPPVELNELALNIHMDTAVICSHYSARIGSALW